MHKNDLHHWNQGVEIYRLVQPVVKFSNRIVLNLDRFIMQSFWAENWPVFMYKNYGIIFLHIFSA